MRFRRTATALVASTLALTVVQASVAAARHQTGTAAPKRAPLHCGTQVVGVNQEGRLVLRDVVNRSLEGEKQTPPLPFSPTAVGYLDFKDTPGGYKESFSVIARGERPKVIEVTQLDRRPGLTFATERMRNSSFSPRLFATSGGFYDFTVTPPGALKRWTLFQTRRGQLFFDDPQRILTVVSELTTLGWAFRKKVDGVESDYLWGTTKGGALVQIRVPVDRPGAAKLQVVKRHGFKGVTDLSLSVCGRGSTSSIIAVDATQGDATWFTVTDQFHPRAGNVTNRGLILDQLDWKLHAVI